MKLALNPDTLCNPIGPYSVCTISPKSHLLFVSGCTSRDAQGQIVGEGNMEIQARQCMENLVECIKAAGAELSSILKLTTYVTSFDAYSVIASIRDNYIPSPYPASTMVQVARLNDERLLIEIEAIVAL